MTTETIPDDVKALPAPRLQLSWRRASEEETAEHCIACDQPMIKGQPYYPDESGGPIHASCCGPEAESYTKDGEPLRPGDAIPEPQIWREDIADCASRPAEAAGEADRLREALRDIAESDDMDNALDPERNKRVARAALTEEAAR